MAENIGTPPPTYDPKKVAAAAGTIGEGAQKNKGDLDDIQAELKREEQRDGKNAATPPKTKSPVTPPPSTPPPTSSPYTPYSPPPSYTQAQLEKAGKVGGGNKDNNEYSNFEDELHKEELQQQQQQKTQPTSDPRATIVDKKREGGPSDATGVK